MHINVHVIGNFCPCCQWDHVVCWFTVNIYWSCFLQTISCVTAPTCGPLRYMPLCASDTCGRRTIKENKTATWNERINNIDNNTCICADHTIFGWCRICPLNYLGHHDYQRTKKLVTIPQTYRCMCKRSLKSNSNFTMPHNVAVAEISLYQSCGPATRIWSPVY